MSKSADLWGTHQDPDVPLNYEQTDDASVVVTSPDAAREMIAELVSELHDPAAATADVVYIMFDDGELCQTKGGALFLHRNLHVFSFGYPGLRFGVFPERYGDHTYVVLPSVEAAERLSAALPAAYQLLTGREPPTVAARMDVFRRRAAIRAWAGDIEELIAELQARLGRHNANRLQRRWSRLVEQLGPTIDFAVPPP